MNYYKLMSDSRIITYLEKLGYSVEDANKVVNSPNRKYVEQQLMRMESDIKFIKGNNEVDPMDVLFQNKGSESLNVEVVSSKTR